MCEVRHCLHFVGFKDPRREKDERFERARRVFGYPDFFHGRWDTSARREIAEGDTIIFAKGSEDQEPSPYSFDDSANF